MKQVFICTASHDEWLSVGETILGVLSEDGKRINLVEPHNIKNSYIMDFFQDYDITSVPVRGGLWEWGKIEQEVPNTEDIPFTLVFKNSQLPVAIVGTKVIAKAVKNAIMSDSVDIRPTIEQDYQFMKTGDFKS